MAAAPGGARPRWPSIGRCMLTSDMCSWSTASVVKPKIATLIGAAAPEIAFVRRTPRRYATPATSG
jgi:hypothetical protein